MWSDPNLTGQAGSYTCQWVVNSTCISHLKNALLATISAWLSFTIQPEVWRSCRFVTTVKLSLHQSYHWNQAYVLSGYYEHASYIHFTPQFDQLARYCLNAVPRSLTNRPFMCVPRKGGREEGISCSESKMCKVHMFRLNCTVTQLRRFCCLYGQVYWDSE